MRKKALGGLLVLALMVMVPGTALAGSVPVEEAAQAPSALAVVALPEVDGDGSSCPPNVRTCVDNTAYFGCRVLERVWYGVIVWLVNELFSSSVETAWSCQGMRPD